MGLVIPPTLVIEQQMEMLMTSWGTSFLNLSSVSVGEIAAVIQRDRPFILLSNIERLDDTEVQAALLSLHISYVAIDEAQVYYQIIFLGLFNKFFV